MNDAMTNRNESAMTMVAMKRFAGKRFEMKACCVTRWKVGVAIGGMVLVAVLAGCSKPVAPATTPEVVRGVRVDAATSQEVPDRVAVVGSVQAVESAALAAQVTGSVVSVAVKEGDTVRSGQTLVTLDGAQYRSDMDRAQAAVNASERAVAAAQSDSALAASTLQRYQILQERKSISPQEFDEVKTKAQAAGSRLELARAQSAEAKAAAASAGTMLGYTRLRAPFDGVVVARKADPGALATPGVPLLLVDKTGRLQLDVAVDESLLGSVQTGASIPVSIDALAQGGSGTMMAKVSRVVPAADAASHSFEVKLDLPTTAHLRSGMYGRAELTRGPRVALTIPASAVVRRGSLQEVYVVGQNQLAGLRYITLGVAQGDRVEVLSGLTTGEVVVTSPGSEDLDGKRIEVQR